MQGQEKKTTVTVIGAAQEASGSSLTLGAPGMVCDCTISTTRNWQRYALMAALM
jgi:hypothetical protein